MNDEAVLNQDEVNALLNGMKQGTVKIDPALIPGDVRSYDLGIEARTIRGRMRVLETINEQFARLYRASMYGILQRSSVIAVGHIKTMKYSDYLQSLPTPTSLNIVKINPLRGSALVVVAPDLVGMVVDIFFGGNGQDAKVQGRNFSAGEIRVIQMLLQITYADLKEAWSKVLDISIESIAADSDPQFVNIVAPSEVVVVNSFAVEVDGASGEIHITIPYSALEPMREMLNTESHGVGTDSNSQWSHALREEMEECDVSLTTVFGRGCLTLGKMIDLKPGDIVPCDFQGSVTVYAEDVPILRGGFGVSRGQMAVQVTDRLIRGRIGSSQYERHPLRETL
jgi:flagellar motor switch protein FliM